jgi:NAD(P)-dependent dehydrogenase (short-subunit alcohol dehydrogenase family)
MPEDGRLGGRVLAVTGAGAGIGRACAMRYAADGAAVVVNDIDAALAEQVVEAIRAGGGRAVAASGDVSEPGTHQRAVEVAVATFGRLDGYHNNAGIGVFGRVADLGDDDWRRQIGVVLDGAFYGTRAALGVMLERGGGAIVNTISGAGLLAERGMAGYTVAKHGLVGLTRATAVEYADRGIRANGVCPGPIHTPAFDLIEDQIPGGLAGYGAKLPSGRLGRPEDVAAVTAFLLSDDAVHVNGAIVPVDAGLAARLATPPLLPDPDRPTGP